mgnify:CR=1 FL=1
MPSDEQPEIDSRQKKAFAERLRLACDNNPKVPPLNHGRQTWISQQFAQMFNRRIPPETIRKWLSGLARPYDVKMNELAQIVGVDPVFLGSGHAPNLDTRQRRIRSAEADGVVNMVAGLIQLDGGHPAFPEADDQQARADRIDLYAIIKGGKFNLHIALGRETDDGYLFTIPKGAERSLILGVIRTGPFCVDVIELDQETVESFGASRSMTYEIPVSRDYQTDDHAWRRITSFANRL